ncbi:MAG: response regulator transcription factor, partial [Verrucomicrobiota bacterium]
MNGVPLRFLLADDHAIVRAGVRQILSTKFHADFTEAENAQDALAAARDHRFDLILLDVTMGGRSGLDILGELKTAQAKTPILVLSMHAEDQFALRALRSGASGYITKSSMPNELVKAVEKVLSGGRYVSESLAEVLAAVFQSGDPTRAHSHETLS